MIKINVPSRLQYGGNIAMRKTSNDLERPTWDTFFEFTGKPFTYELNHIGRQVRQVAECFVLDLPILPKGSSQQDRSVGLTLLRFRNRGNVNTASFWGAHSSVVMIPKIRASPIPIFFWLRFRIVFSTPS